MEILKQDQYQPLPVEKQVLLIFAAANRYLDDVAVSAAANTRRDLYTFVETNYSGLLKSIREKKAIDDAVRAEATKALDAFKESFQASVREARSGG